MANKPQPERSLPVLIRLHGTQEPSRSLDVNPSDHSMESDLFTAQAPSSRSSLLPEHSVYNSNGWQSPPPTPLPDPDVEIADQLMDGIVCGFGETLPSRATTLIVGNERAADVPATLCTVPENPAGSQTDGSPALHTEASTPRADGYSFGGPIWSASPGERDMFGHDLLPLTPALTPIRKRSASPPSAPRQERRRRVEAQPVDEALWEEFSVDIGFGFRELARSPAATSGSEGQLDSDLVGTPGYPVSEPETCQPGPNESETASYLANRSTQGERVDQTSEEVSLSTETRPAEESRATRPRYTIEIECFSEDELEEYLAALLSAYRAFYLEPDRAEPSRVQGDPDRAQRSRRILKTIFDQQLGSAEDEEFLLREEEEDILDAFMEWAREREVAYGGGPQETFETRSECLERLESWTNAPVAKNIHLSVRAPDGSLFTAHLPARDPDGIVDWKLGEIQDMFNEMAQLDIA
ncbi:hypothetical protein VTG60DRAFT_2059 [Thermothelomyces hinnuleus]